MLNQIFTPIQRVILSLMILFLISLSPRLLAQKQVKPEELFKMSLEELMDVEVVSASKVAQRISKVPATIRVITANQIRERGYLNLDETLSDLPGLQFRNMVGLNSYIFQRGVPSQNNLILVLIEGVKRGE